MVGLESLGPTVSRYSPEFTYVRGYFRIGGDILPYFQVAMKVQDAVEVLTLPRDVIFDPTERVELDELFQRELDEERVTKKIVPYLKLSNRIKFFNSFSVAIMPTDPNNPNRLASAFPDGDAAAPEWPTDQLSHLQIGPIRIRHTPNDPDVGYISWNLRGANSIIIDGQHRLFALKVLLDDATYQARGSLAETQIPVILIVLDPRAGFIPSDPIGSSMLKTARSIFVDLNRHSVQVSTSRNYLLDDRDIVAVSMRAILTSSVGQEGESTIDRVAREGQIPLVLVDWYSDASKFDTGLHCTTVVGLYDMVANIMQLPSIDSGRWRDVDKYLDTVEARLNVDAESMRSLRDWRQYLENEDLPFGLREEDTTTIASAFQADLADLIRLPLVELAPYKELIRQYEQFGALSGRYESWLMLDDRGKSAWVGAEEDDPSKALNDIAIKTKRDFRYGYQSVFQKAFITALVEMEALRNDVSLVWGSESLDRKKFVLAWIERFNRLFAPELSVPTCWQGAGIRANTNISWTQASQRAIAGFIVTGMLAPLDKWARLETEEEATASAVLWLRDEVWGRTGKGRSPVEGLLSTSSRSWRDQVRTYVRDVARAGQNETLSEEVRDERTLEHSAQRLVRIIAHLN